MQQDNLPVDDANPRAAEEHRILDDGCALRRFLDLFCNRWTSLVVNALFYDTRRFSELQRLIPGISKKMLSQTLHNLEDAGLVQRVAFAEVPSHTEYSLTPLGRQFVEPLDTLSIWAKEHKDALDAVSEHKRARRKGRNER
jgi:DNA-binding HxlR family transcriptional regulator